MTTAERIIERLDWYERAYGVDPHIDDEWNRFIWALAGKELHGEATQAEEGAQHSTVAVFCDGSAVRCLEDKRRWVVEVPA